MLLGRRLLLGHAVDRPESPDQISTVNSNHFAVGKDVGQNVERNTIIWIVEDRHQHNSISDIEICIAGREPASFEVNRRGHG